MFTGTRRGPDSRSANVPHVSTPSPGAWHLDRAGIIRGLTVTRSLASYDQNFQCKGQEQRKVQTGDVCSDDMGESRGSAAALEVKYRRPL